MIKKWFQKHHKSKVMTIFLSLIFLVDFTECIALSHSRETFKQNILKNPFTNEGKTVTIR